MYYLFFILLIIYILTNKPKRIISYGIMIIVGAFGVGKTFNIMKIIKSSNAFLTIGNFKSSYFDLEFRSIEDLLILLKQIKILKKEGFLKGSIDLVIDEGTIYFFSRFFQKFPQNLIPFLVQLRKLDISLFVIVQNIEQLDNTFIRLSNIVRSYKKNKILDEYIDLDPSEALAGLDYINSLKEKEPYRINKILGPILYKVINGGGLDYNTKELIDSENIVEKDFDLKTFIINKLNNIELKKQNSLIYKLKRLVLFKKD